MAVLKYRLECLLNLEFDMPDFIKLDGEAML